MTNKIFHKVIRLRKGKPNKSQVYWIVVTLNRNKASSQKIAEKLGFLRFGPSKLSSIDYSRLTFHLNRGVQLKQSVKKLINLYAKGLLKLLYKKLIKE